MCEEAFSPEGGPPIRYEYEIYRAANGDIVIEQEQYGCVCNFMHVQRIRISKADIPKLYQLREMLWVQR